MKVVRLLGLLHASWHLPLFIVPGHVLHGQSFPVYVIFGMALSVAFGWLYANTGGSLLLAMLMHSAWNQAAGSHSRADRRWDCRVLAARLSPFPQYKFRRLHQPALTSRNPDRVARRSHQVGSHGVMQQITHVVIPL